MNEPDSDLVAHVRSIERHAAALASLDGSVARDAVSAETKLLEVILRGVGPMFVQACDPIVTRAVYRIGGRQDLQSQRSKELRGVCLTGENCWPRERSGYEPPLGEHADSDVWAVVGTATVPTLYRSTYTTEWHEPGQNLVRWTQTLTEISVRQAHEDGLMSTVVAERMAEALESALRRAQRSESETRERVARLKCILGLLTSRGVARLLALALAGLVAATPACSAPPSEADARIDDAPADAPTDGPTGCTKHSDCASDACLPDSTCADEQDVAYLSSALETSSTCTRAEPCGYVDIAQRTGKPIWRVYQVFAQPHPQWSGAVLIDRHLTVLGDPGRSVIESPPADAALFACRDSTLVIDGVQLLGAGTERGIEFTGTDGTLAIRRATIEGFQVGIQAHARDFSLLESSIVGNVRDALVIHAERALIRSNTFARNGQALYIASQGRAGEITNNLIVANRAELSAVPERLPAVTVLGLGLFAHNTIVGNTSSVDAGPVGVWVDDGWRCANNVVAQNRSDSGEQRAQTGGCMHARSLISYYAGETPYVGNLYLRDGEWRSIFVDPATDFHLRPASSAVDFGVATMPAVIVDHDGHARMGNPDVGAFEAQ